MREIIKKTYNLNKFLFFPYNIFSFSIVWKIVFEFIVSLFAETRLEINGLKKIILFVTVEAIIICVISVCAKKMPRGSKSCHNIFIILYPENINDDKYITDDFVENLKQYINELEGFKVIIPSLTKRYEFNRKINRKKKRGDDFWESKQGKRIHKKLGGELYITGMLCRRKYAKKEHFVFSLTATIGYNEYNKSLIQLLRQELNNSFQRHVLLDCEYEFEEFNKFSKLFAATAEYIIGFANLVGGRIDIAYKLHLDILENEKSSLNKTGIYCDIKQLVIEEIYIILNECKKYPNEFIDECSKKLIELSNNDGSAVIPISRCIVMMSSEEDFYCNVKKAFSLLEKARINRYNRATVHADRGYLNLLLRKYTSAENEYRLFFKYFQSVVIQGVIDYCDEQIKTGTAAEKPTAYYVKVLMLNKISPKSDRFAETYSEALLNIPESEAYYIEKLRDLHVR